MRWAVSDTKQVLLKNIIIFQKKKKKSLQEKSNGPFKKKQKFPSECDGHDHLKKFQNIEEEKRKKGFPDEGNALVRANYRRCSLQLKH